MLAIIDKAVTLSLSRSEWICPHCGKHCNEDCAAYNEGYDGLERWRWEVAEDDARTDKGD
jgi:hypothetical protein